MTEFYIELTNSNENKKHYIKILIVQLTKRLSKKTKTKK